MGRWRAYLETLARPRGSRPTAEVTVEQAARIRPRFMAVDPVGCWHAFEQSEFSPFIPQLEWPHPQWTGPLVAAALGKMREGAAPGIPGIPLAVWKALPDAWLASVARLFTLVELEGAWPTEWLEAYVVMIPKTSGGSRPRDQRPITVLPVVYRLWSKGVTLGWTATMQRTYLGQVALGFRA